MGKRAAIEAEEMRLIQVNPDELNEKMMSEAVMKETGCPELELSKAEIYPLDRFENVEFRLSEIARSGHRANLQ